MDSPEHAPRPKKLGYLSAAPRVSTRPDAEAGGPRSHVLGVIRAFESLGWTVDRFIVGDRMPRGVAGGGSEKALSGSRARTLAADLTRLALGLFNALRARRELSGRVDWVYERHAVLQSLGWVFRRGGTPWILETSGLYSDEAKTERNSLVLTGVARRLEVFAYDRCDVLVCVSEPLKELVVRETGVREDKILVVPNGVDAAFFDPALHEPRRLFDGFTVGFVGSLLEWQGLDRLLRAVAALRAESLPVCVAVVGDGPAREGWEGLAQELGILGEAVRFVGRAPLDEVPGYIAGFDAGFSGQQGMKIGAMYHSPLKLYEYLSMGKPIIATAYDDARNLVRDTDAGFLFEPGNTEDLQRALREAYASRETFPEAGRRAREEVLGRHSWEARLRAMIPRVEEILHRRER
ncbi:glycosyltransferase family 4 protein [Rubrobacter marinus]|uniref:glycosyltransferase family 4 protein n=1 Tax=Rubrobacter marinus TaxID=2653852 RepID=UPI001A9F3CC9|nr:glycosyltransferase family 4 protein [Rubrobacter marinus]